jgi:hypothetical protein
VLTKIDIPLNARAVSLEQSARSSPSGDAGAIPVRRAIRNQTKNRKAPQIPMVC